MSQHLSDTREARRRLSLLALANQHQKATGTCLGPEALAALVEGRITAEQRAVALAHLADCESCYDQWLRLDRFWREQADQGQPEKRRLPLLIRPRHWAAVGSLLAAAASIAVFFSITERVDQQTMMSQLHEKPRQEIQERATPAPAALPDSLTTSKQAQPAPSREKASSVQDLRQPAAPPPQAKQDEPRKNKTQPERKHAPQDQNATGTTVPMEQQRPSATAEAERHSPYQDRDSAVGSSATTSREEQMAGGSANSFSASTREQVQKHPAAALPVKPSAPSPLQEWHAQIRQGCTMAPSKEFLDAVAKQGRALLDRTTKLPRAEQQHIQKVLAQLERPLPAERQCQAILVLLPAQEHEQRP